MPIFASTTTSGYSDPLKAQSIKALEQRYKDMLAQSAQAGAITPENTQTPIQGFGHLANQLGDSFQRSRVDQAAAAQRDVLAKAIAGYDPNSGPPPAAVATTDPELYKSLLSTWAENRRAAQQQAHEVSQQGSRQAFEGGQKTEDRTLTKAGQEQQAALAREQMDVTKGEGAAGRTLTRDMATQTQRAAADLAQAERDMKVAEAVKDRALKTGTQQEQIAADKALEEIRGRIGTARDAAQIAATATEKEKDRAAAKTLKEMGLLNDKEIAQLQIGSAERIAAEKAREVAGMPLSEAGKVVHDEKRGKVPEGTAAAQIAPKPKQVEEQIALEQGIVNKDLVIAELDRAGKALGEGINMGKWAPLASGIAQTTQGRLGDLAQAQRTAQFDAAMEKVAIGYMSTGLKGQSTDFEMKKFINIWNNKEISMNAKREAFADLVTSEKKNREIAVRNVSRLPGANVAPAPGGGAAPAAAAPVDPLEGKIADGPDGPLVRRGGKWVKQ